MKPTKKTIWQRYKEWVKKVFPGKDPKVIEKWDFIMVFEERYKDEIEAYFQRYINFSTPGNNFKIISHEKQEQILVLIAVSEAEVFKQAQALKILKRKQKKSFGFDLKTINREIYLAEQGKNLHLCNYLKWIRARLMPENKKIYMQEQYSVFNCAKIDKYLPNEQAYDQSDNPLFTPEQQLRTKYNYLLTYCIEQERHSGTHQNTQIFPFSDVMHHAGFKELVPIHKDSKFGRVVVGNVTQYVGANSQTYFAFVAFLQKWIIIPAIIGIVTFLYNVSYELTADDSPADFLYAFAVMIWSIIFVTQWQHKQKWTAACNQTGYSDDWSEHQNQVDKQGCKARESILSGQKQFYVPWFQKMWRYLVSYFICSGIFLATLYFMVLSLNARGFVDSSHKFLYFQQISNWAKEGGMFDANTAWGQIPNLVHVLVTNVFDEQIYRPLAKKFTKYEQHFSNKGYENNIIIKFFVYEFIITFADLFYIAFVRMDIVGLREQLLSLFFIDIVRRVVAELLIPKIISIYRSKSAKPSNPKDEEHQLISQAIIEVTKDEYQPFDDYLEIVTNFGYLVMLSSCFPLAPLLIFIAHSIESIQDKYKIIHIFKRKLPQKYVGMGYWNNIILFLCYSAIITNILLFAFSSHQIVSFFPKLYESGKDLLLGETGITEIVQNAADSFISSVADASSMVFDTFVEETFTPYETFCQAPPLVTSFLPPSAEHEVEFISILFIIEHVFLILFICLRNILSKQRCDADVLLERRHLKRGIKKYFKQRNIISEQIRNSVLDELVIKNHQAQEQRQSDNFLPDIFSSMFTSKGPEINKDVAEALVSLLSPKNQ